MPTYGIRPDAQGVLTFPSVTVLSPYFFGKINKIQTSRKVFQNFLPLAAYPG